MVQENIVQLDIGEKKYIDGRLTKSAMLDAACFRWEQEPSWTVIGHVVRYLFIIGSTTLGRKVSYVYEDNISTEKVNAWDVYGR